MDALTAKIDNLEIRRAMWVRMAKDADSEQEADYCRAEIEWIDKEIKATEQEWQKKNAGRELEDGESEAYEQTEFHEYPDY